MDHRNNAKLIELTGTPKEIAAINAINETAHAALIANNNINISRPDAIATIAYAFLHAAAEYLAKTKEPGTDISVNMMNLLEMGVTYRESEDGEKDGNFVPYVQPGTIFKTIVKSDEMTEDDE